MKHVVTLTILTVLVMPIDASAASPGSETNVRTTAGAIPGPVVTVDASVPNASIVHRRVEASAREALARLKAPLPAGERVLVHVTGEQYEYSIRVSAVRSDATLEESTVGCECNTAELSERVSAEVTRVAARFSESMEEPSTTAAEESAKPAKAPTLKGPPTATEPKPQPRKAVKLPMKPKAPPHSSSQRESLVHPVEPVTAPRDTRRMRVASVATLIAGSVLLFAGAGLMGAGSTDLLDDLPQYKRDWRPLGFAIGGAGLAGIAVGGSLMLVEELRCRRRPGSCVQSRRYAKLNSHPRFGIGASQ